MQLVQIASLIASSLADRKDTFSIENGYVSCDLGGTFEPLREEMQFFAGQEFERKGEELTGSRPDAINLKPRRTFEYSNPAARLYYEVLKKDTNFDFVELRIKAAGAVECSIIAQTGSQNKVIQQQVLNFGPEARTLTLPFIDLISLPKNGSLVVSLRSLGGNAYIYGFRWIGKVPASRANMGERIVLLRTFGHKARVMKDLALLANGCTKTQAAIFERTLFILYDGETAEKPDAWQDSPDNLRLLILEGPALAASPNASLLISLLLQIKASNISELVILDEDTVIEPETLLRHDSFITGRKQNIISTAALYSVSAPSCLHQYNIITVSQAKNSQRQGASPVREDLPYLAIYSEKITQANASHLANAYRALEFSPFTFLSFPYALLEKCGAPLPLFVHNGDMEIFQRCMTFGGKIVVHPNLQILHDPGAIPGLDFHTLLHGLLLNSVYGDLDKKHFYLNMLDKFSKLAETDNYALLRVYELALEKFAEGPGWMTASRLVGEYRAIHEELTQIISDFNSLVTDATAQDNDKHGNRPQSRNWATSPALPCITGQGFNFGINSSEADERCLAALGACIGQLQRIVPSFDELQESWKKFLGNFSHTDFWGNLPNMDSFTVAFQKLAGPHKKAARGASPVVFEPEATAEKTALYERLPQGFTIQGYLDSNPDVKEAGVDPVEHWFRHGQFENRSF